MKRALIVLLALSSMGAVYALGRVGENLVVAAPAAQRGVAALERTLLVFEERSAVQLPTLVDARGAAFGEQQLRGRWSLVFFGFTSCPDVCPTTLAVLSDVARDSAAQVVFVSVNPGHDTPEVLATYLANFNRRIVGVTGRKAAIDSLNAAVGAAYTKVASGFDHSTSVFVLDPAGRLAGIMLRPSDPARIVSDLASLRK